MTLSALGLFSTELVLTSIAVDNYFLGLFFCINMISTASLALDLTFVWDFLVGYERFNPSQVVDDRVREESGLGQFSHSGRVGTRLARILRILRLIRILRIFTSTVSPQQTQAGEWSVALQVLHGTLHMLETEAEDGPSRALIDYMESCNSTPPSTWSGYRHLDNERQEMCPPQQFCANVSPRHDSASYDRHYIRQFDTNTRAMPSSRNSTQNASKPNLSAESFPDDARPCVAAERRPLPHPGDRGASRDRDEELDLDLPRLLASNRLTKKI
eukprot:CAMPEP_0169227042 /NCGR_PEP_ID=MMETSP1016-20121227/24087_1 /TAXON_ID=342587 /ORGANISM="Karlodinium micrum, Strain CCMP2283" /LENGTH=271 /DNA_ID=CAMNT_0009305723 /DNA_START=287 /DNA_END=1102 /DNA_ORIENTATION=-